MAKATKTPSPARGGGLRAARSPRAEAEVAANPRKESAVPVCRLMSNPGSFQRGLNVSSTQEHLGSECTQGP